MRIDLKEVSGMKLILFIVYKQNTGGPLREGKAGQASTVCFLAKTRWAGCISFHHDHSFTAYCFVYIKLNCNATPERYNWPQS